MAHVDSIWIMGGARAKDCQMKVNIKLTPSGSDSVLVDVPADFFNTIIKIAQLAADLHEQKVRAQILADTAAADQVTA